MLDGAILVGGESRQHAAKFSAINPATNEATDVRYSEADSNDVADACALAEAGFASFSELDPHERAAFLEAIADAIVSIGDVLIETAMAETGLPRVRLEGERGRTVGQLRMFASEVRRGDWLDVTIDPALPERAPPRADLRRMNVALGPVAVFGASNFPLAFSVAGGDTAAAFAAGCPVIVKGHPAHPGTGELVARANQRVVAARGLHAGAFSYLPGASYALGAALVSDSRIKAAAFTGSRRGGMALVEIAARRATPIPVFAEMSSINPVVLMSSALAARADTIAAGFASSMTLGVGQFCTNPGIVVAQSGPGLDAFLSAAASALSQVDAAAMLSPGIWSAYADGVALLAVHAGVRRVAAGKSAERNRGVAALFETDAATFLSAPELAHEVFGPASLVVRCASVTEMEAALASLEGQLTASIHLDAADESAAQRLLPLLRDKAGRVLANGWPTGVEVTHAMVHGGPYPATSDGRTTSVGTLAMMRFLRPVCYQDIPDALLPAPLRQSNPWGVSRRINGERQAL